MNGLEDPDDYISSSPMLIDPVIQKNIDMLSVIDNLKKQNTDLMSQLAELECLRQPPYLVATVIDVGKEYVVIMQHGNNTEFAVRTSDDIRLNLLPGDLVLINAHAVIICVLKSTSDQRVRVMELTSNPDVLYSDIGGLEQQLMELREVVELPLNQPEVFRTLGIEPPRGVLLYGPPGTGKCWGFNTPIIMYDGTIKMVQDIKENELVMGPDSMPRLVRGVTKGHGKLYKITPIKGDSFICNEDHILNLTRNRLLNWRTDPHRVQDYVNISVKEYLLKSNDFKHSTKLWKTGIELSDKEVPLDPYVCGLWIGDGTIGSPYITHTITDREIIYPMKQAAKKLGIRLRYVPDKIKNTGLWKFGNGNLGGVLNPFTKIVRGFVVNEEKRIPSEYLLNSRDNRLKLLAGLIDTDGYNTNNCIEIVTKYKGLSKDIKYLAGSLGFMVTIREKAGYIKSIDFKGVYYRLFISGNLDEIPIRVTRKKCHPRHQQKNVLHTGFTITDVGEGDYYGFTLDKDGLCLLGDFTVTHNTVMVKAVATATNATFIQMAATELVQKFIGEGARLVRDLFQMARDKAPSIIFIDEIDAVAAVRTNDGTTGSSEVFRTMMQLLSEMDGFKTRGDVKIIAATNRLDILDPAILRPGRFDRLIEIPLPNEKGRLDILNIHTKKMPLSEDVDLKVVSLLSDKFNGAQLRAVATEAGMCCLRRGGNIITRSDFIKAVNKVGHKEAVSSDQRMCW